MSAKCDWDVSVTLEEAGDYWCMLIKKDRHLRIRVPGKKKTQLNQLN